MQRNPSQRMPGRVSADPPMPVSSPVSSTPAESSDFGSMPASVGHGVLQTLLSRGDFENFDFVCQAAGRRWSLTGKSLNVAVATATLEGDPRWLSSLLRHKLTQSDHMSGCSLTNISKFGWLRGLAEMASRRPDGWEGFLSATNAISSGWTGAFGDFLTSSATPPAVKAFLREVESRDAARRAWSEKRGAAPGFYDDWQMSCTPLVNWMKKLLIDVMDEKDPHLVLQDAVDQARKWVQQGADAGAWSNGTPAILLIAPVEPLLHESHPQAIDRLVELFDVLAPSVDFSVVGGSLRGIWWQNQGLDMAQGLASSGATELARRAIHWGSRENHRDLGGRSWKWHAWANGAVCGVDCPAEQFVLKSELGVSLPRLMLQNLRQDQDHNEVAQALHAMRRAGLDFNVRNDGVPLRQWVASASPFIQQVWAQFEALELEVASPKSSFSRPSARI